MTQGNTLEQNSTAFRLNQLVASHGLLYVKLHQYHWHVQGPLFFTLHEKLEELYNETTLVLDEFAERMLAMGEKPFSTLAEFLEHSLIKEEAYTSKLPAEEMVENLVNDYRVLRDFTVETIETASESGDYVTEDMLVSYKTNVDKTIWMLQAYLGNETLDGE